MADRRELDACYSSSHPDVIRVWDEVQAMYVAMHDGVNALVADYELGDRTVYEFRTARGVKLAGFGWPRPGPRWREADRRGPSCWVPYKSKAKGDPELWKRFEALAFKFPELPGMPVDVFSGMTFSSPSWNVFDGVMWVCWSQPHDAVKADLDIWTLNKPSTYYAAKEAAQEEPANG